MKCTQLSQFDEQTLRSILLVASSLQTNKTYQAGIKNIKSSLRNSDIHEIINIIQALKIVLTFEDIRTAKDILELDGVHSLTLEQQFRQLILNQYSKLLAVRLVRDLFFMNSYEFMVLTFAQLGSIFRKIALFMSTQNNPNKGKYLFANHKNPVFQRLGSNYVSEFSAQVLQKIAFSIHKLVIEIVRVSSSFMQCTPYHEKYIQGCPLLAYPLQNPFHYFFRQLKKNKAYFPPKIYYFKLEDIQRYEKQYKQGQQCDKITKFYKYFFDLLYKHVEKCFYSNGAIKDYEIIQTLLFYKQSIYINKVIKIYKNMSSHNRHFWEELTSYVIIQIKLVKREQTVNITSIMYVLSLIVLNFCNPQVVYFIVNRILSYLDQMHYIFFQKICSDFSSHKLTLNYVSARYNLSQQKLNQLSPQKKKSKKAENHAQNLASLLNFLIILNQLSYLLYKQLNISQYKNLCIYLQTILSQIPSFDSLYTKIISISLTRQRLKHSVQNEVERNRQMDKLLKKTESASNLFGRLELMRYKKTQQIKEQVKKYNNVDLMNLYQGNLLQQEIFVQGSQVHSSELQVVAPLENNYSLKNSSFKLRLSQFSQTPLLFETPNKSESQMHQLQRQSIIDSNRSLSSFRQSLSIDIKPINKAIFRSLSRKKRRSVKFEKSQLKPDLQFNCKSMQVSPKASQKDSDTQFDFKQPNHDELKIPTFSIQDRAMSLLKLREQRKQIMQQKIIQLQVPNLQSDFVIENESLQSFQINQPKTPGEKILVDGLYFPEQTKEKNINNEILFFFLPRVKKQLLKRRILVHKNNSLQTGIIIQAHQKASQRVRISVYISALSHLEKVSINAVCPNWVMCKERTNILVDSIQSENQKIAHFDMELMIYNNKEQRFNYGSFPTLKIAYCQNGRKIKFQKPIPFLITNFFFQVKSEKHNQKRIINKKSFQEIVCVHERIATKIKDIRSYFKHFEQSKQHIYMFTGHLQKDKKVKEVGLSCMKFGPTNQELTLAFIETQAEDYNWNKTQNKQTLYLSILAEEQQWDFQLLHAVKICWLSIFSV